MEEESKIHRFELELKVLKLIATSNNLCLYLLKVNENYGFGKLANEGLIIIEFIDGYANATITDKGLSHLKINSRPDVYGDKQ